MQDSKLSAMTPAQKIALGSVASAPLLLTSAPAFAQETPADPVGEVNSMVTSIGTITTGVIGVVVAGLTVRLAVKQVNRLMTKG